MFTVLQVPHAIPWRGIHHARTTEAMEDLSDFAFKRLARLRRLIGDGGQIKLLGVGCRAATELLNCSAPSVYPLLNELADAGFVRWWTDERGTIALEIVPVDPEQTSCKRRLQPMPDAPETGGVCKRRLQPTYTKNHDQLLASSKPNAHASEQPEQPEQPGISHHETQRVRGRHVPPSTPVPAAPSPVPDDPRLGALKERQVYLGLARKVLAQRPDLTIEEFDRMTRAVQQRGGPGTRIPAAAVVAKLLAEGEAIETETDHAGQGQAPSQTDRVSDALISLNTAVDPQTRGVWLGRFRAAATPDQKREVLARFQREVLGGGVVASA